MYRVLVRARGEQSWNGNGLTFDTVEAAAAYGVDLLGRWLGADGWRVVAADAPSRVVDFSAEGVEILAEAAWS